MLAACVTCSISLILVLAGSSFLVQQYGFCSCRTFIMSLSAPSEIHIKSIVICQQKTIFSLLPALGMLEIIQQGQRIILPAFFYRCCSTIILFFCSTVPIFLSSGIPNLTYLVDIWTQIMKSPLSRQLSSSLFKIEGRKLAMPLTQFPNYCGNCNAVSNHTLIKLRCSSPIKIC